MFAFSPKVCNVFNPDIIKVHHMSWSLVRKKKKLTNTKTYPFLLQNAAWYYSSRSEYIRCMVSCFLGSKLGSNTYSIISGPSVACPYISAATEIIRFRHKSWSPAAVVSVLMPTPLRCCSRKISTQEWESCSHVSLMTGTV